MKTRIEYDATRRVWVVLVNGYPAGHSVVRERLERRFPCSSRS